MGVYGFAVGCTITNAQTNNTKRDRNGLAGYDFRPCMAGKFPQKTYMCAQTQRGNEGLGRVGMGSDGYRGMN